MSPAQQIDHSFIYILTISVIILIGITITMIYFAIHYSRAKHPKAANIRGNWQLEVIWIIIPTIIALTMFYSGWKSYLAVKNIPPGAMEIKVVGEMYVWLFTYENGRETEGLLVVPEGRAIALDVTSNDVVHSIFIPAFRLKIDAVGGLHNHTWFLADEIGEFDIHCAEFCGVGHSSMDGVLRVVPEAEFKAWLNSPLDQD